MSFRDEVKDAVREVLREELLKLAPATKTDPRQHLTPEQVADLVQFSADTVRAWCASGKLRARKVGGAWRVRPADLDAFLEREGPGGEAPAPDPREVAFAIVGNKR